MRNLLDKHMSVVGLKILTKPLDIMNKDELEQEIKDLGTKAFKADAIRNNLSKNISIHYDSNPAYYETFSKRIKDVLEQYKNKVITDAEYMEAMVKILYDYRNNNSGMSYPQAIKGNVHAQAFYGVILPIINEDEKYPIDVIGDIALKISDIITKWAKVDWSNNLDVHNSIAQDIDDLFWQFGKNKIVELSYNQVDKVIENVKTVALKRF